MDKIAVNSLLFENLWLLGVAWFAVQFVLIAIWSWRRTRGAARGVWVGFALLPLLIALSICVVTPREKVINLCEELAGFVDDGNVRAIALRLTDDCTAGPRDRQSFLAEVERTLTEYRVDEPSLSRFAVEFQSGTEGAVRFTAAGRVRSPDMAYDWLTTRWRLEVRLVGEDWRVSRVQTRPGGTPGIGSVLDLIR